MNFSNYRNRVCLSLSIAGLALASACLDKASKRNDTAASETKTGTMMAAVGMQRSSSGTTGSTAGMSGVTTARANGSAGMTAAPGGPGPAGMATGNGTTAKPTGAAAAAADGEDGGVPSGATASNMASAAGMSGGAVAGGPATGETSEVGVAGAPADPGTTDPGTTDPGTTAPNPALVAGTGTKCASYATPANGKCGTYYCGVDLATLSMALDPSTMCGKDADFTCNGNLVPAVGTCARRVKSENLFDSNDALRPKVEACVYEDAVIKEKVPNACLACFINAAICAGDNCLTQCLAGDSPGCDSCRKQNNCEAPVFSCAGLPSPF
jgi:hypothetical protein